VSGDRVVPDGRGPWDPGLQNERTALAWLRSVVALVGVALVVARVTATHAPLLGLLLATVAIMLGMAGAYTVSRRYGSTSRSLRAGSWLPDGRLPALVVVLVLLTAAWALGIVIVG
jgi:uncharacterized membrane protein YidH (DUF202 family)